MYPEYLMHYGVKGMRWGVRKKRESEGSQDKSKKRKRALAIAGGVAGAALATAGGIAAYKNRGKILGGIAKKTNAERMLLVSSYRKMAWENFSKLADSYLADKVPSEDMFISKQFRAYVKYGDLLRDLQTKPMSKKKFNAGIAFAEGLLG